MIKTRVLFSDTGFFRNDRLASVNETCEISSESNMVTVNDDCHIDIVMLCNGIMNCDDCADEIAETCMTFDCSGGTKPNTIMMIDKNRTEM